MARERVGASSCVLYPRKELGKGKKKKKEKGIEISQRPWEGPIHTKDARPFGSRLFIPRKERRRREKEERACVAL